MPKLPSDVKFPNFGKIYKSYPICLKFRVGSPSFLKKSVLYLGIPNFSKILALTIQLVLKGTTLNKFYKAVLAFSIDYNTLLKCLDKNGSKFA